jgi:endonuclease YncB( thermonuclease family)
VLDGETFAIEDGREVRLIGALVPEPPEGVTAEEWIPSREAKAALTSLIEGRNVELALPGRKTDRYGRLLAHVFVPGEGEPIWVQGHMLRHGAARAYAIPGSSACLAALLAAEAAARDSRSGLWSHATYAVRPAADVRALSRQRGRFAVVDGEVMATAERGGRLYINFGADWRRDFTIIVPSRVIRAFPDAALRLREIKGARLRVRGWIDRRNGPSIEVSDAGEIEILEHPPH